VKVPDFIEFKHKLAAVTLAEMLNYDQAAKRLGITPSELKRQIETLEAGLSLSIFKVVQDVPSLTADGRYMIQVFRGALSQR
jgi:DNA-binding transcriptional LysR family regulator